VVAVAHVHVFAEIGDPCTGLEVTHWSRNTPPSSPSSVVANRIDTTDRTVCPRSEYY
jgi:hypothetical protein